MNSQEDPLSLAENDESRSRYIYNIIQECLARSVSSADDQRIPKNIIQFWHQSDEIPDDVNDCLNSWKALNTRDYKRALFDDEHATCFIRDALGNRYQLAFDRCYHPAMRCDYFRLCYLLVHGGFYIDADELYQGGDCDPLFRDGKLKLQPLCYDKEKREMVRANSFLSEKEFNSNWIYYLNNNPIICPKGHPVVDMALERATKILLRSVDRPEIQSTTGPGNLTACVVRHAIERGFSAKERDIQLLFDWESVSVSPWPLSYRNDERNWRHLT